MVTGGHDEDDEDRFAARSQDEFERHLIQGAVRTDLVMSIEIIFIAMASMKEIAPHAHWVTLSVTLGIVGYLVTKIVYGLVKGLIRLDDVALHMIATSGDGRGGTFKKRLAARIIRHLPVLMKTISGIGCAAMLFVSGELIAFQFPMISDVIHHLSPGFLDGLVHFLGFSVVGTLSGVGVILLLKSLSFMRRMVVPTKNPISGGD